MRFPRLPVSLLDDGLIECGDYPDWVSARWTIERHPVDREILDDLIRSIPEEGLLEPLTVGVWRRNLKPYLSDGHHRAVALSLLRIPEFPYRWYWKSRSRDMEWQDGPLPEYVLEGLMQHG